MRLRRTAIAAALAMVGAAAPAGEAWGRWSQETAFLQRMAGEWSVVTEATLGPGEEPVRTEIRVAARRLGTWLVAEGSGSASGRSFTWILTLGYDPDGERFVGTWIDSNQTHLWRYEGALDESGRVLTLETEGPILGDPTTTARYRETIEVEDADHHVIRSMILGPDGEWFEFARAEYRRIE